MSRRQIRLKAQKRDLPLESEGLVVVHVREAENVIHEMSEMSHLILEKPRISAF